MSGVQVAYETAPGISEEAATSALAAIYRVALTRQAEHEAEKKAGVDVAGDGTKGHRENDRPAEKILPR